MFKKFFAALFISLFCFLCLGCKKVELSVPVMDENLDNSFRYSAISKLPVLDPQKASTPQDNTAILYIQEPLVRMYNGKVEPGLAENWIISEDRLVYTFNLRNAVWSDGRPITAYDIEFSVKRLADPTTKSDNAWFVSYIKNGVECVSGELELNQLGVKALDEGTIQFELEKPTEYFLQILSNACYAPSRADIVEQYKQNFASCAVMNVYSGPFEVKNIEENRIVLSRNENYWNSDNIKLDYVEIVLAENYDTAVEMFNENKVDCANIPDDLYETYKETAEKVFDGSTMFLRINENSGNEIVKDKNFKMALNSSIDRSELCASSGNIDIPSERYIMKDIMGIDEKYSTECPLQFYSKNSDSDKAKQYIDKVLEKFSCCAEDIKIEILTSKEEQEVEYATILQQQMEETLGIDVEILSVADDEKIEKEINGDFCIALDFWKADYSDPYAFLQIYRSDSFYNFGGYNKNNQGDFINNRYDELLDCAETTYGRQRMNFLFEAEKSLMEDYAVIPLLDNQKVYICDEDLQNIIFDFNGQLVDCTKAYWK